ncbi:MAG: deoxyribodipyrimidine photo-lyase [Planctomycetota bacterium]|jgi:deoxyribodipyrimidine photo-lyase
MAASCNERPFWVIQSPRATTPDSAEKNEMIQKTRIESLNSSPLKEGRYVLYWMQTAQRAEYNHALEYATYKANQLKLPLVVVFGITDAYPEANLRHYAFMLEGLVDVQKELAKKRVKLVIRHQSPELAAIDLSENASMVVVDGGHTRLQWKWRQDAAQQIDCLLEQVETNVIVPIREVSDKENFSAGTLRPRIHKKLSEYLIPVRHRKPRLSSLDMKIKSFDVDDIELALSQLTIDRSVGRVTTFKGGTGQAKKRLNAFIKNKLDRYSDLRNDPSLDATSNMSPYLHFGQISALYIALKVMQSDRPGKEDYLEELIVRRELSYNLVYYNRHYDRFSCLPPWARNTLNVHARDKREYIYTLEEFEKAQTHDPYWNAAQKEMVLTGKMHGYMRMYWGKKILEWTKSPRQGYKIALYLNNKYELDGRDPNGFAGVAWCFGKHDRAWSERKVFGKVRYMNAAGLKRKFDAEAYVDKIKQLQT